MSIKDELLAIKQANPANMLFAPEVVDWARSNPTSKLHKALQWDDTIAAQEYRISQVRQLIRLHIISEDGTPQLVSLSFDRKINGGYRNVSDVLQSKDLSEIMLADALAELERVQTKYQRVQELTTVWREVEQVKTRRRRRAAKEQPAQQAS